MSKNLEELIEFRKDNKLEPMMIGILRRILLRILKL